MIAEPLAVRRLPVRLAADPTLTITRLFWTGPARARSLVGRVMDLDDAGAAQLLVSTRADFGHLHENLDDIFLTHYEQVAQRVAMPAGLTDERKLLLGAYFTLEYAFASAALFNPSITPAVDQSGLGPGSLRFAMSLRAVGEGHVSSIIFRRGVIDSAGAITMEPAGPHHEPVRRVDNRQFSKAKFRLKLTDMGVRETVAETLLAPLDDMFTTRELRQLICRPEAGFADLPDCDSVARDLEWLACCDYDIEATAAGNITQLVLFPICVAESQGMEDMRLVRFTDEDGAVRYYGTYTAYNGRQTRPQLVEMPRPGFARVRVLRGRCARNKGLALFPRKIQGRYVMSGRIDGENLYLMTSDNVLLWDEAQQVQEPQFSWEFVQVGNCGSPIETEAGWLLLTHGVGPMRRYCIGAMLLDLNDPAKVIGRLEEPLLVPAADERRGYVPNVVYSCGGLVHNGILVIPYGISDAATGFATVALNALLARLR